MKKLKLLAATSAVALLASVGAFASSSVITLIADKSYGNDNNNISVHAVKANAPSTPLYYLGDLNKSDHYYAQYPIEDQSFPKLYRVKLTFVQPAASQLNGSYISNDVYQAGTNTINIPAEKDGGIPNFHKVS